MEHLKAPRLCPAMGWSPIGHFEQFGNFFFVQWFFIILSGVHGPSGCDGVFDHVAVFTLSLEDTHFKKRKLHLLLLEILVPLKREVWIFFVP